jgi:signal transduction histidine kinase
MNMGGMARNDQYTLIDPAGKVLLSESLEVGQSVSDQAINNALPIVAEGQIVGYLIPDRSLTDLSDLISAELNAALKKSLLPTALISAGAAIAISLLLAYLLMRPVRKITIAADQIASGNLSERVPVTSTDELGQMAVSFNEMAASLEEMQRKRRAMTADIAHELRTPLAVQKANLEALQDGIYPLTHENLTPLVEQNNLLTKLVNDLRTLTLADTGSLEIDPTPTDMSALIAQVATGFKAEFESRGVKLLISSAEDCPMVEVDQQRIRQVINNLLQNSLNHTPKGGLVSLQLACRHEQVSIQIRDTGEGIPPDALSHIFDRFYRADVSRSRDKGGSGLGLTIAKRLVRIHGGTITAENHPEGGAVFTILLPTQRTK